MIRKVLIACCVLLVVLGVTVGTFFYLAFHRVQGQYFDSNGFRIHYTVEGKGEPVILIHGLAANADLNWRRPGITRTLARDFQVIAFDLRGHGLSGVPTEPAQYGVEMAEDVIRLMDHLQIKKAHVAGYSLGGFILLKLMAGHPDRVISAALGASGWKSPGDTSPIPNPYAPPPKQAQAPAELRASALPLPMAAAGFRPVHSVRRWIGDRITPGQGLKACRKSFPELKVTLEQLKANTVPSICFIGTNDGLRGMAEDLRQNMANLEFVEIDGANHLTTPLYGKFRNGLHEFFMKHRSPTN